jgi:hypothetical protein
VALVVAALAAWLVAGAVTATPSGAHASGELPSAELSADGTTVRIELVAPADDAAVIGTSLGYLGEGAMLALLGGPAADLPTDDEIAALSRSPQLRDYLERHVQVRQDGVECPGEAVPAADFLSDGAVLTFDCPEPVELADVRITVLHDDDPAYRTFSFDGTEQYAIHSAAAPEHTWDFTLARSDAGVDPWLWGGALALVAAGVGTLAVLRPRRRGAGS